MKSQISSKITYASDVISATGAPNPTLSVLAALPLRTAIPT
jgi:hypothetical protein